MGLGQSPLPEQEQAKPGGVGPFARPQPHSRDLMRAGLTMRRILPFALLLALLVAGCSRERGVVYPVAPERVRQILTRTELPPVFGSDPPSSEVRSSKPSEVTWIVSRNGHELMRYVAT